MPINILMPALSPTMEEGTLTRWFVEEGATVAPGDIIAEIETDKAMMDVEAVDEGTIGKLLVTAGTSNIKVNDTIAILLAEGEDAASQSETGEGTAVTPPPEQKEEAVVAPATEPTPTAVQTTPQKLPSKSSDTKASPVARRLAQQHGLDLTALTGTGPNGRIVKRDIEMALEVPSTNTVVSEMSPETKADGIATNVGTEVATQHLVRSEPSMSRVALAFSDDKVRALYEPGAYDVIPHDAMRTIIAERLTYSKQTIPHFRLTVDCRIDELLRARQRMNATSPENGPHAFRLSVNDFLIKGLGLALQQVPGANCTWTDGGMLQHKYSDVGVAVAIEGGLYTPILRHCELKSLSELSNEIKDLAARARERRLAPHEYQGGATSISNLGMYGIKNFDAVINPPQASILAVGTAEERPVISNGSVEVAQVMSCTLSCDHRVIDGAVGANFLDAFKLFIEDPVRMLV